MRDRTSLFSPISLTKLTRPATTASSTVFGQASPSSSAGSSSSSNSSFDPLHPLLIVLPRRASRPVKKGGIVVACVATAVAIVVGWGRRNIRYSG